MYCIKILHGYLNVSLKTDYTSCDPVTLNQCFTAALQNLGSFWSICISIYNSMYFMRKIMTHLHWANVNTVVTVVYSNLNTLPIHLNLVCWVFTTKSYLNPVMHDMFSELLGPGEAPNLSFRYQAEWEPLLYCVTKLDFNEQFHKNKELLYWLSCHVTLWP